MTVVDLTGSAPPVTTELARQPAGNGFAAVWFGPPQAMVSRTGAVVLRSDVLRGRDTRQVRTWSARLLAGSLADVTVWRPQGASRGGCAASGLSPTDVYVEVCFDERGLRPTVRRSSLDGTVLGETRLAIGGIPTEIGFDPGRPRVYLWSGANRTLTVVDLEDGFLRSTVTVPVGYETTGWDGSGDRSATVDAAGLASLAAISGLEMEYVSPAMAVSPDGSRIYAIALDSEPRNGRPEPPALLVFDTATRDLVARWPVDGDVNSLALSEDGRLLYAASLPVYDDVVLLREATVTVFDTDTGRVRLIAGRLGGQPLLFRSSL
jgi:hypothetical protein